MVIDMRFFKKYLAVIRYLCILLSFTLRTSSAFLLHVKNDGIIVFNHSKRKWLMDRNRIVITALSGNGQDEDNDFRRRKGIPINNEVPLRNLNLFDLDETRLQNDQGKLKRTKQTRRTSDVYKYSLYDVSKNYETTRYIDSRDFKDDVPPGYIPDGVYQPLPPTPSTTSDQIPDISRYKASTFPKTSDKEVSSEELRQRVFQDETGFLNQTPNFKQSLNGDKDAESQAKIDRRGNMRQDGGNQLLKVLEDEMSSFSESLDNEASEVNGSKNRKKSICKSCGAIKFVEKFNNPHGLCQLCDAKSKFVGSMKNPRPKNTSYYEPKRYSSFKQQNYQGRKPTGYTTKSTEKPRHTNSYAKQDYTDIRATSAHSNRNVSSRNGQSDDKRNSQQQNQKYDMKLKRAESVIRSLESVVESQRRKAVIAEREIAHLKQVIVDLESALLIATQIPDDINDDEDTET